MTDPAIRAAEQIARIEAATGQTAAQLASEVSDAGLEKHGAIISHLKASHGLTHGNANAMAHAIREHLAGGPPSDEELLANQYAGAKAPLRPIMEAVIEIASALGDDVSVVAQKTGVSLRRAKQFALVQAPSSKRVQLGLNLNESPESDRVKPMSGMCSHRADLTSVDEVDADVAGWLSMAYEGAS